MARALTAGKPPRVAGSPRAGESGGVPRGPEGGPSPGVPTNTGIQTAGRTWRARPGAGGRGRLGAARGAQSGAATAREPPAPRRWEGETREPISPSARHANFPEREGKWAAAAANVLAAPRRRGGLWDRPASQRRHKYIFCKKEKKKTSRANPSSQLRGCKQRGSDVSRAEPAWLRSAGHSAGPRGGDRRAPRAPTNRSRPSPDARGSP